MKLSVSLNEDDVVFVDEYAAETGAASRSAVIHQAIALLKEANLEQAYTSAWAEGDDDSDTDLWDTTSIDGLTDAAR